MSTFRNTPMFIDRKVGIPGRSSLFGAVCRRWVCTVFVFVLVTVAFGCRKPVAELPELDAGKGILLISLDTVSAEHLSLYGYDRDTTPFLEEFERRGAAVFNHAYVQLPGTLPSHMSIFTSLYPDQHQVFPPDSVLNPAIPTIPQVFQHAGYRTHAFTEGGFVSARFGFDRGFESYNQERILIWTGGDHVFKKAARHLEEMGAEDPFFLFVHTYAAHDPYTPPPECATRYWKKPLPDKESRLSESRVLTDHNSGFEPLSPDLVEYYRSQYDAEIRCLDAELRIFFDKLDKLGILDQITVVITSDHGEEFLEHGKMAHEQIYNENLHVPLLMLIPGVTEGRRIEDVVESIDIAPTLYELAGLEAPPTTEGKSLVPLLQGLNFDENEAFSRSIYNDRALISDHTGSPTQIVTTKPFPPLKDKQPRAVASYMNQTVNPGEYDLQFKAYQEASTISVLIDGDLVSTVTAAPDSWTPLVVDVPGGEGTRRLRLESDTCIQTPKSIEKGTRFCLSFFVRGLPKTTTEVFRTAEDRRQQHDLSLTDDKLREELDRRLALRQYDSIAERLSNPLEEDLEEQLRALGYLE